MADFDKAIEFVLLNEGALREDGGEVVDTGGHTKFGISKKGNPDVDIDSLTLEEAKEIYKKRYWDPYFWSELDCPILATKIFDFAVNAGPKRAILMASKLFLSLNLEKGIDEPIRSITDVSRGLNEACFEDWEHVVDEWIRIIVYYYVNLAKSDSKYLKYKKGWLNRAKRLPN